MPSNPSSVIQTHLIAKNYCSSKNIEAKDSINVVAYNLNLNRTRNTYDTPYGNGSGGRLKVTLDVGNLGSCGIFYEHLALSTPVTYTLMYKLPTKGNKDGSFMVFDGYIVNIEENYVKTKEQEHLYMDIEFLITYTAFVTGSSIKDYQFSN